MAERADTWMPLYVADYLKDTQHLSTQEHGAYLLLIMYAWSHEGLLPPDEKRVARIAGLMPKEWKDSRDVLLEFFTKKTDGFRHKRIEKERARATALNEQRREAGKASAAARAAARIGNERSNDRSNENSTSVQTEAATKPPRNGRPLPSPSPEEQFSNLPEDVRAIMSEGGYVSPPGDLGTLKRWYDAGAELEQDILPVIRRVRPSLSKAPFTLKVFDPHVREKLAADQAEIERLRNISRRYEAEEQRQAAASGGA